MLINTKHIVTFDDAADDLGRVTDMVDDGGAVLILKDGQPAYAVVAFSDVQEDDARPRQRPAEQAAPSGPSSTQSSSSSASSNEKSRGACGCDRHGAGQHRHHGPRPSQQPNGGGRARDNAHQPRGDNAQPPRGDRGGPRPFGGAQGRTGMPWFDDGAAGYGHGGAGRNPWADWAGHFGAGAFSTGPSEGGESANRGAQQPQFLPDDLKGIVPDDVLEAGQHLVSRLMGLFTPPADAE